MFRFLFLLSVFVSGNSGELSKIINGKPIPIEDVPAQASLFRYDSFICGATFISPRTAITAAHCVIYVQYRPETLQLRYGSSNTTSDKRVSIIRVALFPAFSQSTLNYDLAVLTLADSVDVPFATLPEIGSKIDPGTSLAAVGWGKTENGYLSKVLLWTKLATISLEDCRKVNPDWLVSENMFCATGESINSTTCGGDSGSGIYTLEENPLRKIDKPATLLGVVSWGDTLCSIAPVGFADLTNRMMRDWLRLLTI